MGIPYPILDLAQLWKVLLILKGFPDSSVGKESVCNAGDPGLIPGLGRSRRRDRLPTPVFLDSLVAQIVKNLPVMQETWVRSLGWEDPLEEGMATHSSILAWRNPMDRGAWRAAVHRVTKSQTRLKRLSVHARTHS